MSFKMNNGFSNFSENYLKIINNFINGIDNLPEKPFPHSFDNNYFKDLKNYENQYLSYFLSILNCLYQFLLEKGDFQLNDKIKDAYYKIRNDYKEYRSYLKKAKLVYNESKQIECFPDKSIKCGSMSPSNPFYSTNNIGDNNVIIEPIDGDLFLLEESENIYFIKELKKLKKLIKEIKKRNKKKKLTKNQRKKLKRKLKNELKEQANDKSIDSESFSDVCISDDPQVMIQDFFKQYAQTGEWSWSLWNSYITRIQQINPEWFDLFNRYSHDMGINWNAMFTSDINAQNASNVRLEVPERTCSSYEHHRDIAGFVFNENEGKSVIFTSDVKPCVDDLADNELYCSACKHEFKTKRTFHIHLRGVKHIQNEINFVKDQKPDRFITEVEKQNASILSDISKEEKHLRWRLNNPYNAKIPGNFTCTICDVTCTSAKDFQTHVNGNKHCLKQGTEEITSNTTVNTTQLITETHQTPSLSLSHNKRSQRKIVSRIQIILNTCTQPLIGLDYITEYQRLDELLESKYVCDLCKVKFERKSFIAHVVSYRHRERYLKSTHHTLYDILRQDHSSKSIKLKRLEIFAEQVENFEGRKKVNVMLEKKLPNNDEITSLTEIDNISQILDNINNLMEIDYISEILKNVDKNVCDKVDIDCDDENVKEDGEVESSDEESCLNVTKISPVKEEAATCQQQEPIQSKEELEAGEIENNYSDKDSCKDNEDEAVEEEEEEDDGAKERYLDVSEFANYDIVYRNNRKPSLTNNLCLIGDCKNGGKVNELTMQKKNLKKVKLKEVTVDIIDYFKQEAIWALNHNKPTPLLPKNGNRVKEGKNELNSLLLHSISKPIGPFNSSHSYYSKSNNKSSKASLSKEEIEFTNIIDKMSTVTKNELNIKDADDILSNGSLLLQIQNILVNKTCATSEITDLLRKELLLDDYSTKSHKTAPSSSRRPLLPDPIDLEAINHTLIALQQMITKNTFNRDDEHVTLTVSSSKPSKESSSQKLGEKLTKMADFLGLNQPPPPTSFPKFPLDIQSSDSLEFPPCLRSVQTMYPFFSPGMIEHHQSLHGRWTPYPRSIYSQFHELENNNSLSSAVSDSSEGGFQSFNS